MMVKAEKKIWWILLCCSMGIHLQAQQAIISSSSRENRARIVGELPKNPEKQEAERYAKRFGIPVRQIDNRGRITEIMKLENGRHPLFYSTNNMDAARTVSTDKVWDGQIEGLNLRGKNILVAVWDGGKIRTTHVEFGTRVHSLDSGFELVGHATHVAGTIGAAGLEPDATGMASQCFIEGYDWDNDDSEMRQAAGDGLLISNHSYGFTSGFDYNSDEGRWEWRGDVDIDEEEDYKFGFYSQYARTWDDIAYDNPYYLIVKSAGNDRLEGPGAGAEHYVLDGGWKASNKVRDKDGGPDGFDCIGMQGTAKNILTVGAVMDIETGYQSPDDVEMTSFSTFGPTDDGRIKPDIVGNGYNLYSTYYTKDTDYNLSSGTSMASPNVAGSLALLQELYFKMHNRFMRSASLKGLVLHSADDAGNAGPDYKFGWGLLNTYSAAKLLSNGSKSLVEDSIADQSTKVYRLYTNGDSAIKLTVCWTDPRGPMLAPALDPRDTILINDLDIRLIKLNDSSVFEPYILMPETPDAPAQTGDNFRDNIEQIFLASPDKGYYDLVVTHKDTLRDTIQQFSLISEGVSQVFVAEDSTFLDDNNGYLRVTDAPEYPLDRRFVWLIEPKNQLPLSILFTEFDTDTSDVLLIYDGPDSSSPVLGKFSGGLTNPDTLLISSGGSLFMEFSSGTNEGFKGFASRYCTTAPEEEIQISGNGNPCFNSPEIYSFTGSIENSYLWSFDGLNEDSVSESNNSVLFRVPEDQFTLGITPLNGCGTGDTFYKVINPLDAPPVVNQVITGDTLPCTNGKNLFWVENDPTATYRWKIPEGWSGRSDSSSILIIPEKAPGTIIVYPGNSCGESEGIELDVDPMSLPRIPVIQSDRISPCENSITEFHILSEDIVNYVWEAEDGWQILGEDTLDRVVVQIGAGTAGRMFLTSANKCGDTLTSRNFLLSPSPEAPDLIEQPSFIEGMNEIVLRNYSDYAQVNWFRNDSLISDIQGDYLIPQRNGTYGVEVANSEGCLISSLRSQEIRINSESLVYNISTGSDGVIKIENDTNVPASINVYDLTGRTAFSNEVQPGTNLYHTTRRGLLIVAIDGGIHLKTQLVFVH